MMRQIYQPRDLAHFFLLTVNKLSKFLIFIFGGLFLWDKGEWGFVECPCLKSRQMTIYGVL